MKTIEVHFNWYVHPEHGDNFNYYRVGERYPRQTGGFIKCEAIRIEHEDGLHAVIQFEDGTTEQQWNINKIIDAEDGYDTKEHKTNQGPNQFTEPSIA